MARGATSLPGQGVRARQTLAYCGEFPYLAKRVRPAENLLCCLEQGSAYQNIRSRHSKSCCRRIQVLLACNSAHIMERANARRTEQYAGGLALWSLRYVCGGFNTGMG